MKNKYAFPLFIIALLFFIFGLVTWLNSILIPYLKIVCELKTDTAAYLVTFAFFISYTVMALPSSLILEKIGFKNGMIAGLLVMALGTVVFMLASQLRLYPIFLAGLFVIGTGLALLQTASNPYLSVLGSPESAAQRISIMGICNKVAGMIGIYGLAKIVFNDYEDIKKILETATLDVKNQTLNGLSERLLLPYFLLMLVLIGLALLIRFTKLPTDQELNQNENENSTERPVANAGKNIFEHKNLVFGVIALFLYVGVEVIAGDTIVAYAKSKGVLLNDSQQYPFYTLLGMLAGYLIAIVAIPKWISQQKALAVSAVLGILFSFLAIFTTGTTSVLCIALLGLANSVMWPAIFPLAIKGLGKFTKKGAAFLIMAISGGAILPILYGLLADASSQQRAYWILVPSYAFILLYGAFLYKGKMKI